MQGTVSGLSFTFKRSIGDDQTFGHFTGIQVDAVEVAVSCYDAAPGSVVVTLHSDYLETLAPGEHELQAFFDDGNDPSAAFTVLARQDDPTGGATRTSEGEDVGDDPADGKGDDAEPSERSNGSADDNAATGEVGAAEADGKDADDKKGGSASEGKQPANADQRATASESRAASGEPGVVRTATVPNTGDIPDNALLLPIVLAGASAVAFILLARKSRQGKRLR